MKLFPAHDRCYGESERERERERGDRERERDGGGEGEREREVSHLQHAECEITKSHFVRTATLSKVKQSSFTYGCSKALYFISQKYLCK